MPPALQHLWVSTIVILYALFCLMYMCKYPMICNIDFLEFQCCKALCYCVRCQMYMCNAVIKAAKWMQETCSIVDI